MTKTALLTPEILRQLLDYDPETGLLTYRNRPLEMFSDTPLNGGLRPASWAQRKFNTRYAGKHPCQKRMKSGHLQVVILGVKYLAHRVAWMWVTGAWPKHNIDHIDGNAWNNAFTNLRDVPQTDNGRNARIPAHNTSGYIGVGFYKAGNKWRADIKVDGVNKFLGYFDQKEDAIAARAAAESRFGFHKNHGRAASKLLN